MAHANVSQHTALPATHTFIRIRNESTESCLSLLPSRRASPHFRQYSFPIQGRSQKFILGGYNFLLHDTTVLYTSSLTTSAAISAQNNFQGLILGGYIYRYTPVATPLFLSRPGQKAELAWVAGYMPMWFARLKTITQTNEPDDVALTPIEKLLHRFH